MDSRVAAEAGTKMWSSAQWTGRRETHSSRAEDCCCSRRGGTAEPREAETMGGVDGIDDVGSKACKQTGLVGLSSYRIQLFLPSARREVVFGTE